MGTNKNYTEDQLREQLHLHDKRIDALISVVRQVSHRIEVIKIESEVLSHIIESSFFDFFKSNPQLNGINACMQKSIVAIKGEVAELNKIFLPTEEKGGEEDKRRKKDCPNEAI